MRFKILSLLKKEDNTLNTLSEKLDEDISIIKPHIKKLENEGIIDKNENQMTIPQFKYDEITIEIE
ncbi:MAG: ArsR family transcriptional regulator [Methanosphaera sp.]|nr:ArsR family transcriptional regulator [Methanosphaera sp.]